MVWSLEVTKDVVHLLASRSSRPTVGRGVGASRGECWGDRAGEWGRQGSAGEHAPEAVSPLCSAFQAEGSRTTAGQEARQGDILKHLCMLICNQNVS